MKPRSKAFQGSNRTREGSESPGFSRGEDVKNDGMQSLISEQIDHWLKSWHAWSSVDRVGGGYNSTAPGCGMYRASRQYDDANGALDHEADMAECQAVDAVIQRMPSDQRIALHIEARNLSSARVWSSPRINPEDLARVTAEARKALWDGMAREGLA